MAELGSKVEAYTDRLLSNLHPRSKSRYECTQSKRDASHLLETSIGIYEWIIMLLEPPEKSKKEIKW
jgi:hypothetical protein